MFMVHDLKFTTTSIFISGSLNWDSIGTDSESAPLLLTDYMSYDEVKLASFLW